MFVPRSLNDQRLNCRKSERRGGKVLSLHERMISRTTFLLTKFTDENAHFARVKDVYRLIY